MLEDRLQQRLFDWEGSEICVIVKSVGVFFSLGQLVSAYDQNLHVIMEFSSSPAIDLIWLMT